ncbi:MAG: F0F1 ATP synthase subunit alpha, partial [Clostridia bacterium]|nr:F0F1 ATP synthase subunit alpha [Clostridia bacterium]
SVAAAVLGGAEDIREGMQVKRSGYLLSVPVGEGLLGRVVDALGNAVDGKGGIKTDAEYPIESPAPGIMQRRSVYRPLETGVKAVDSMIPIGKGQRELIIGDRQTGKTSLAIDTIINQHGKNMVCIYVAIGQKQTTVAGIAQLLEREDAMAYSIIITEAASASPAMQYIAPFSGCAMAEFFMRSGRDVLIVYDDLSKHAAAYRALSLLLRRPPGREAYPGDVFYLHSRLLERAVQLSDSEGGGSITALPIIETLSGDVSAYIPTNVISITDGQIFLESEMYRSGLMPAIDPGISVSRVGGSAQYPAMRKMSGKLRIMYSQYRELKSFSQFGTDLDADTRSKLEQGRRMEEVFRQNRSSAVPFEKQAAILFALINGYIDRVQPEKVCAYEAGLYGYLDMNCAQLLQRIRESGDISAETEAELRAALCAYSEIFSESGGKNGG